jgi:hypothetical protein
MTAEGARIPPAVGVTPAATPQGGKDTPRGGQGYPWTLTLKSRYASGYLAILQNVVCVQGLSS